TTFIALFFFQAEDGIRDWSVTGVQTCALPIFHHRVLRRHRARGRLGEHVGDHVRVEDLPLGRVGVAGMAEVGRPWQRFGEERERSEERRVGKEWRCRWAAAPLREESEMTWKER